MKRRSSQSPHRKRFSTSHPLFIGVAVALTLVIAGVFLAQLTAPRTAFLPESTVFGLSSGTTNNVYIGSTDAYGPSMTALLWNQANNYNHPTATPPGWVWPTCDAATQCVGESKCFEAGIVTLDRKWLCAQSRAAPAGSPAAYYSCGASRINTVFAAADGRRFRCNSDQTFTETTQPAVAAAQGAQASCLDIPGQFCNESQSPPSHAMDGEGACDGTKKCYLCESGYVLDNGLCIPESQPSGSLQVTSTVNDLTNVLNVNRICTASPVTTYGSIFDYQMKVKRTGAGAPMLYGTYLIGRFSGVTCDPPNTEDYSPFTGRTGMAAYALSDPLNPTVDAGLSAFNFFRCSPSTCQTGEGCEPPYCRGIYDGDPGGSPYTRFVSLSKDNKYASAIAYNGHDTIYQSFPVNSFNGGSLIGDTQGRPWVFFQQPNGKTFMLGYAGYFDVGQNGFAITGSPKRVQKNAPTSSDPQFIPCSGPSCPFPYDGSVFHVFGDDQFVLQWRGPRSANDVNKFDIFNTSQPNPVASLVMNAVAPTLSYIQQAQVFLLDKPGPNPKTYIFHIAWYDPDYTLDEQKSRLTVLEFDWASKSLQLVGQTVKLPFQKSMNCETWYQGCASPLLINSEPAILLFNYTSANQQLSTNAPLVVFSVEDIRAQTTHDLLSAPTDVKGRIKFADYLVQGADTYVYIRTQDDQGGKLLVRKFSAVP